MAIFHRFQGRIMLAALLWAAACGAPAGEVDDSVIEVWAHSGQEAERAVLEAQIDRFNRTHEPLRVDLTLIPEGAYDEQVQAAALAGDLPDVLELDGPFVASYAWRGHLRPLDPLVPDSLLDGLLPSILEQGRYRGRLWALGTYDSGLGLFARRSALEAAGIAVPATPADAWTAEALDTWMASLAQRDDDGAVLDLHLNYPGEWYTYAFAPAIRSAGGTLLDVDGLRADGALNSPESVRAMTYIQRWIMDGLVDPNVDDAAFVEDRVPLSWSGHWDFARYREAWGDDVVALPLPDFGRGTRTGQGSWVWAVTASATDPETSAAWIRFLLTDAEVEAMATANAAVPARTSVAAVSPLYGPDGPLRILLEQLEEGFAVPRPRTPAYPIVTSAFQEAFDAIRSGRDIEGALTSAAELVDQEIEDNRGYPAPAASR